MSKAIFYIYSVYFLIITEIFSDSCFWEAVIPAISFIVVILNKPCFSTSFLATNLKKESKLSSKRKYWLFILCLKCPLLVKRNLNLIAERIWMKCTIDFPARVRRFHRIEKLLKSTYKVCSNSTLARTWPCRPRNEENSNFPETSVLLWGQQRLRGYLQLLKKEKLTESQGRCHHEKMHEKHTCNRRKKITELVNKEGK